MFTPTLVRLFAAFKLLAWLSLEFFVVASTRVTLKHSFVVAAPLSR